MNQKLILGLALPLLLTGCATPIVHQTPSKKAEVTIRGVSKARVSDYLADRMANTCPDLPETSESRVVCEGPIKNDLQRAMFSSQYDNNPIQRITLNLLKVSGGVRVVSSCDMISNPGSAFEKKHSCDNWADSVNIQNSLNDVKAQLEAKRS